MREKKTSTFFPVYRNDSSVDEIPAFEGQPMNLTLKQQIQAAGGNMVEKLDDAGQDFMTEPLNGRVQCGRSQTGTVHPRNPDTDILLAVNNFNGSQIEAASQPENPDSGVWWFKFEPLIKEAVNQNKTIGFCDNRYANGGDAALIKYVPI